jgi:hypothetical protein
MQSIKISKSSSFYRNNKSFVNARENYFLGTSLKLSQRYTPILISEKTSNTGIIYSGFYKYDDPVWGYVKYYGIDCVIGTNIGMARYIEPYICYGYKCDETGKPVPSDIFNEYVVENCGNDKESIIRATEFDIWDAWVNIHPDDESVE